MQLERERERERDKMCQNFSNREKDREDQKGIKRNETAPRPRVLAPCSFSRARLCLLLGNSIFVRVVLKRVCFVKNEETTKCVLQQTDNKLKIIYAYARGAHTSHTITTHPRHTYPPNLSPLSAPCLHLRSSSVSSCTSSQLTRNS